MIVTSLAVLSVAYQYLQTNQSPPHNQHPPQLVIASRPWELVAVEILKVSMSARGNQYLLVVQNHSSKWPFAKAIPGQKAERIVQILKDDVFTLVGPPQRLHSDQGRNFESHILGDLCKAFGVNKSHTTPYHPMGNGLVERMNSLSSENTLRGRIGKYIYNYSFYLLNHQTYHYRTLTL